MRFFQLALALSTFVFLSSYSIGQENSLDFTLPCDSIENQSGMNRCAYRKSQLLDSVMKVKYEAILKNLQEDIDNYRLKKDSEMVEYSTDLRKAIIKSQKKWSKMADENATFYGRAYEGGSMRSMTISNSRIVDTIDRIKYLEQVRIHLNL